MDGTQFVASMLSGGLAGGCVGAISNRVFYWRSLRTQFYPKQNDFFAAYLIRMEKPEGRYWEGTVGLVPSLEDEEFVDHRSDFISGLIQFNELKEARDLRTSLVENLNPTGAVEGTKLKIDLIPEYKAVSECLSKVQKKLKLS